MIKSDHQTAATNVSATMPATSRELDTNETAAVLGLSANTLKKWRCTHEQPQLRWYKRFRKVFYLESEVLHFRDSNTQASSMQIFI